MSFLLAELVGLIPLYSWFLSVGFWAEIDCGACVEVPVEVVVIFLVVLIEPETHLFCRGKSCFDVWDRKGCNGVFRLAAAIFM